MSYPYSLAGAFWSRQVRSSTGRPCRSISSNGSRASLVGRSYSAFREEVARLARCNARPRRLQVDVDWQPLPLGGQFHAPPGKCSALSACSQSFDSPNLPPSGSGREIGEKCLPGSSSLSTGKCPHAKCSRGIRRSCSMDLSSRNPLQHTKLHRKLLHIRGQGRNHEFFCLLSPSDARSGHPRSHLMRTTSPQLPLMPLEAWMRSIRSA